MSAGMILIIEDEADIREVMRYNLAREGYAVTECGDGEAGLDAVRRGRPDLVLLDLMLPGRDGLEVCRRLKAAPETATLPIVMVSAKGEESDVVLGLGMGADDYIAKPFSPRILLARVRAVLRRAERPDEAADADRLVRDGLVIDAARHEVVAGGRRLRFTATEFKLLRCLAAKPGRVFTRAQLLDKVVGDEAIILERNVDVHVRSIRKKLGERQNLVETVRGVGYRFRDGDG